MPRTGFTSQTYPHQNTGKQGRDTGPRSAAAKQQRAHAAGGRRRQARTKDAGGGGLLESDADEIGNEERLPCKQHTEQPMSEDRKQRRQESPIARKPLRRPSRPGRRWSACRAV